MIPDYLYVLDLDRTLIDTERVSEAILKAAEENGLSAHDLENAQGQIQAAGGSFDVLDAMAQVAPKDVLEKIKTRFLAIAEEQGGFLFEGGAELINQLKTTNIPFVIATYGGKDWQSWKLEAAGLLEENYIITQQKEKGSWIAHEWRNGYGTYTPPLDDKEKRKQLTAKHIVLIDDKNDSFKHLPDGNVRVLVRHKDKSILPSQEGDEKTDITLYTLKDAMSELNMSAELKS